MGEIKKQSINNTILSYIGAGLGFLLIYIFPQLISASDIGLLRLLYSFSWMTAVIMPFGLGSITLRFFPHIRNDVNGHHGFFALLLILGSIGALLIAGVMYYFRDFFEGYYSRSPEFPLYFRESLFLAYILSLITVYTIYSSSLFKTTFTVFLTDIFVRLGQLAVVLLYYYGIINKDGLVYSYIMVFVLQLLMLLFYLWKAGSVSFNIRFEFFRTLDLKKIGLFGLLMMMTAFASLGIKFIDQLMVGHYLNADMVGVYATCAMMAQIMEIPFNSLDRIASPKISYAWSISDRAEVNKIYEMSSRYMFFAGAVLFSLLWYGIDVVFMALPEQYQAGKMAFFIVSFSSLLNLLTGVNSSVIMYSHKYFAASVFLFILIVVSYITNAWLITPLGISGAALATLISIGTFNLLKYFYILYRFGMQPFSRHTVYILAGLTLSLLPLYFMTELHPLLRAFIGGCWTIMVFTLMNVRTLSIEEVNKVLKRFGLMR